MAGRGVRGALSASVAMFTLAAATTAAAQTVAFDLPAQPATAGIPAFARQANIQILVSESAVARVHTRRIKGRMPVDRALRQLIAGTGLRIASGDGRTFTLVRDILSMPRADQLQVPHMQDHEIVVTAQRRPEVSSKVPISFVAYGGDQLGVRSITTERDLQAAIPGLVVKTVSSETQLTYAIRAQSVEPYSGVSPAVLAYVNEVEANSGAPTSFYDLSSVQVLKGPQGTLFGRNTTGGAILYTTTMPGTVPSGSATLRYGNFGMREALAAFDLPLSEAVRLRVAGDHYLRGGYQTNIGTGQRLGGSRRSSGRVTLHLQPVAGLENRTIGEYTTSRSQPTFVVPFSYNACKAPGLNSSADCLFGPGLDAFIQVPGAWNAYLAAHPGANPGGVPASMERQREIGSRRVDSLQMSDAGSRSWYVHNMTSVDVTDTVTLKNILGYSRSDSHFSVDQTGSPFSIDLAVSSPASGLRAGNYFRHRNFTEELQVRDSGTLPGFEYLVGFYFSNARHYETATQNFFDLSPVMAGSLLSYENFTKSDVRAGYGQATYDLSALTGLHGLKATGGFRYTWERTTLIYSDNPGTALFGEATESELFRNPSWQVGLSFQTTPALMLYAVTRGSWRSGGFNPFAPSNPTTAEEGGGNKFLPEKTKDIEVGAKFRGRLGGVPVSLDLAAYSQWVDNVQKVSYVIVDRTPSAVTTNVPRARVRGLEISASIRPTHRVEFGVTGAHTDAVFTDGRAVVLGGGFNSFGPFADVARWSGTVYAQGTLPTPDRWGPISLRGDLYVQTSQYFSNLNNTINPGSKLPGYALLNLRLDWTQAMGSALTVSAFAKNVTGKVYYSGGTAFGAAFGTNGARFAEPRTFGAEVTLTL